MASKGGRVPESHEPGEYHFHYNREEREAMLSEETKRILTKSRLFTLNRRNLIILADIAIILIFAMIFMPLAMGAKSTVRIDGFKASLRAYEYDGSILVSLKVEAGKNNPDEAGLVTASFSIDGMEDTQDEVDLLPSDIDKPRILRAEFPSVDDGRKKAFAGLEINGTKRRLSASVKKE